MRVYIFRVLQRGGVCHLLHVAEVPPPAHDGVALRRHAKVAEQRCRACTYIRITELCLRRAVDGDMVAYRVEASHGVRHRERHRVGACLLVGVHGVYRSGMGRAVAKVPVKALQGFYIGYQRIGMEHHRHTPAGGVVVVEVYGRQGGDGDHLLYHILASCGVEGGERHGVCPRQGVAVPWVLQQRGVAAPRGGVAEVPLP